MQKDTCVIWIPQTKISIYEEVSFIKEITQDLYGALHHIYKCKFG